MVAAKHNRAGLAPRERPARLRREARRRLTVFRRGR